jgi:hypothetical protein
MRKESGPHEGHLLAAISRQALRAQIADEGEVGQTRRGVCCAADGDHLPVGLEGDRGGAIASSFLAAVIEGRVVERRIEARVGC